VRQHPSVYSSPAIRWLPDLAERLPPWFGMGARETSRTPAGLAGEPPARVLEPRQSEKDRRFRSSLPWASSALTGLAAPAPAPRNYSESFLSFPIGDPHAP
jgi:hypothetical protein